MQVLQPLANPCNAHFLPYKEEVAGSNPAFSCRRRTYCNRTATGIEQSRTEQKNESTEYAENRVNKDNYRIQ